MKKNIFIFLLIIIITYPISIKADTTRDYVINKYDVNIKVNENNSYDITETIEAYFNVDKHGIYRKLPLKNTIKRQDGTTSTNRAKITNIKVNENFTTSTESGYRVIKIGDPNYTLTGSKEYKLSYTYNIGKDTGKGYDELYFNIIGSEWDTTIDNVTFYITLPKEFDKTKLGFTSGKLNTIDTSNIEYSIDGKTIIGNLTKKLEPYEALTIRLELPEGYFINSNEINIFTILCFILPILFVFISWYKWNKYGKDDIVVETVEFYPPEGYNSAEVGFLYKGRAQPKDVTSLLIYLANNGYIKISETEEKKKDNYTIIKVKDYDGNNDNEKTFMEGLFKNGRTEVTKDMLYNDFYITNNKILTNINNKDNKNKIYDITANKNRKVIILLIILTICITFGLPCYEYSSLEDAILIVFMIAIYTIFYVTLLSNKIPIAVRIIGLIFITFHMCFMLQITTIIDAISYNPYYLITIIIGIISLIGLIIFFKIMPKRTKFGTDILGKIKGLKNFLETAEKDKLEAMVEKDPTYFYNILPFTYVLGISDKWIKKFEDINIQAPEWYDSNNAFDYNNFNHFMDSTYAQTNSAMVSSPSSDSSSGGGFSGGGSGGGGGGSW